MNETKKLTALSGGKLEAVQFVATVIGKASDKAAKAAEQKGHTIAFGIAYLLHHIGLEFSDAVDYLHQQAKTDGRRRENFASFNHLILPAMDMVKELSAEDCMVYNKKGVAIRLAVPTGKNDWPTSKLARNVGTVSGLTPTEALAEDKSFALLLSDAQDAAGKRIEDNWLAAGRDLDDLKNPDAKALANAIAGEATDIRREAKDAEVVTAEEQSKDEHIVRLIRQGIGSWTQEQVASMAAAIEEAQAKINGVD